MLNHLWRLELHHAGGTSEAKHWHKTIGTHVVDAANGASAAGNTSLAVLTDQSSRNEIHMDTIGILTGIGI
jgi:hypothetical protein